MIVTPNKSATRGSHMTWLGIAYLNKVSMTNDVACIFLTLTVTNVEERLLCRRRDYLLCFERATSKSKIKKNIDIVIHKLTVIVS